MSAQTSRRTADDEPSAGQTGRDWLCDVERLGASRTVRLLDGVVDAIVAELTGVAPERGGALMGLRDPHLVSLFVADAHGEYSAASWQISAEVGHAVAQLEQDTVGLLLGTVHSHPAGVPDPSRQDMQATCRLLDVNPHMDRAVVLVVTAGAARPSDLAVDGGDGGPWRISAHMMSRPKGRGAAGDGDRLSPTDGYRWQRAALEVVPLAADLADTGVTVTCAASTAHTARRGRPGAGPNVAGTTRPRRADRRAARDADAPASAASASAAKGGPPPAMLPVLMRYGSSTRLAIPVLEPAAPGAIPEADASTSGVLLVHGHYPEVGPVAVPVARPAAHSHPAALTSAPTAVVAPFGLWDPTTAAAPQLGRLVRRLRGTRVGGATDRVWPLIGDLATKRVVLVGAGSVGSGIAEHLCRSGVGTIRVIDPDVVTAPNLARTSYRAHHLGRAKVDALADLLTEIDPAVQVAGVSASVGSLAPSQLDELIAEADIAVLATDDMYEQAQLAHRLYAAGVPHVSCAIYAKAAAGEVAVVLPVLGSPCWNCHLGGSRSGGPRGMTNYGISGRLVGEAGLGPSIAVVASYAALAVLAVLAGPDSSAWKGLHERALNGRTLGVIGTIPGWEWFGQLLEGTAVAGAAPQSVWLHVQRDPACAVCGTSPLPPPDDAAIAEIDELFAQLADTTGTKTSTATTPETSIADDDGVTEDGPVPEPRREGRSMPKKNKAASVLRLKKINAAKPKRDSSRATSRKVHDTGGKDLHGRQSPSR